MTPHIKIDKCIVTPHRYSTQLRFTSAMALNWTMLNPDRTPVPLPREFTIMTVDSGAEVSLIIPDTLPTGSASSGGSGGERNVKGTGKLFLTDQRVRSSYETRSFSTTHTSPCFLVDIRLRE
jgi:hypothetical protein